MRNIYIFDYIKSLLLCDKDATGREKFTVHPAIKTGFGKSAWTVMTGKDVMLKTEKRKKPPSKKNKKREKAQLKRVEQTIHKRAKPKLCIYWNSAKFPNRQRNEN